MVCLVKSVSLTLLILTCCILQLTSANCTLEISSQSQKVDWLLSYSGCSLMLTNNNDCNLSEIFNIAINCSRIEYNRTYHLCNTDNSAATNTDISSQNGIPKESSMPEITMLTNKSNENKIESETKSSEDPLTPCTPATVTVCPKQTISPDRSTNNPHKGATCYSSPQIMATTAATVQYSLSTNSDNDRKMECSDTVSIQAMGAVTGILVVLLVVMTSGYIYICWNNMKKRGGLRIISKQMTRFPNSTSIINTFNRTDKTLRRHNNPLYNHGGPDEDPQPPPTEGVRPSSVVKLEDGEPAYEAIPLSSMSTRRSIEMSGYDITISPNETSGDKQMQAHGGVSVGVVPQEGCGHGALELELSQVGLEDEDIENHYHLIGGEELDRQSGQGLRDAEVKNHYHLLDSMQEDEKSSQVMMANDYHHILEENKSITSDNGVTESDYYLLGSVEEATEQEKEERVYHVLEMPGNDDNDYEDPDEGDLFRDYDKQKREREIERSTREVT